MDLASISDALKQATVGGVLEEIPFKKSISVSVATTANRIHSCWTWDGNPGKGAAPGATGLNPDNTTDGGLKQTDPSVGQKWIVGAQAVPWHTGNGAGGTVLLYDRLMHVSSLSGTNTGVQTITNGAVSRFTGTAAKGNQIWVEIYTQIGASAQTLTINFTNESGVASTATVSVGGVSNQDVARIIPVVFGAGDYGVRSVQSVQLGGSTGTVGDFGITIARPLVDLPCNQPGGLCPIDMISGVYGPVEVVTDACLAFMLLTLNTGSRISGSIHFLESR